MNNEYMQSLCMYASIPKWIAKQTKELINRVAEVLGALRKSQSHNERLVYGNDRRIWNQRDGDEQISPTTTASFT